MKFLLFAIGMSFLTTGCMQIHADRDDICTIPTTNNPQLINGPTAQAAAS